MDWIHIEPDIQPYTEQEKIALDILNQGKHYFCISSRLHISFEKARDLVFSIRKKESIIMGKLNDAQRAEIYQAWKDGISMSELAKQYGVSASAICQMISKMNRTGIAEPEQLEDCENGIPNTPLVPQAQKKFLTMSSVLLSCILIISKSRLWRAKNPLQIWKLGLSNSVRISTGLLNGRSSTHD